MNRSRRIAAYAVLTDDAGRHLLRRATDAAPAPGSWTLPGGTVPHGESAQHAVIRMVADQVGVRVEITRVRECTTAIVAMGDEHERHDILVLFDAEIATGAPLERDPDGSADNLWTRGDDVAGEPTTRSLAVLLGVVADEIVDDAADEPVPPKVVQPSDPQQHFGVYGLVSDPDGRILLTFIPEQYVGGGNWHLPGGGLEFGEEPRDWLVDSIETDTGQRVDRLEVLLLSSHHIDYIMDVHNVPLYYRAFVPDPTEPIDAGKAGLQGRWFRAEELAELPLTSAVIEALTAFTAAVEASGRAPAESETVPTEAETAPAEADSAEAATTAAAEG